MAIQFGKAPQFSAYTLWRRRGKQRHDWGMLEMCVTNPFNNRIVFGEYPGHLRHDDPSLPR